MSKKTIYIAGPMRGIKHFNFPAFDAARDHLKDRGWNTISPADLDRAIGFYEKAFPDDYDWIDLKKADFDLNDAVDRDVKAIKECQAIYMLKGWEKSKGATAEKALAEWLGLEVLYEEVKQRKDGDTITNERGGKQSFVSARFDCIPPVTLRLLAQCLGFGARKYGKDNWRNIPQEDNLSHALNHINEWRAGDRSEPHLVNAMARLCFALTQAVESKEQGERYFHPDESEVPSGANPAIPIITYHDPKCRNCRHWERDSRLLPDEGNCRHVEQNLDVTFGSFTCEHFEP